MEIYVGTTGWSNPLWNPNGLSWYCDNSNLNAIELDMPFYQLPSKEQIQAWSKEGKNLFWTVKINRSITHLFRFGEVAFDKFQEFMELFAPLDEQVNYYLFQLPPDTHPKTKRTIETFFHKSGLKERFALEWRNPKWYVSENISWAKDLGISIVSADSAYVPRDIINSSGSVYLRLHGRSDWFEHYYPRKELGRIVEKVIDTKCKRIIAFLNNDSMQLKNARALKALLEEKSI